MRKKYQIFEPIHYKHGYKNITNKKKEKKMRKKKEIHEKKLKIMIDNRNVVFFKIKTWKKKD